MGEILSVEERNRRIIAARELGERLGREISVEEVVNTKLSAKEKGIKLSKDFLHFVASLKYLTSVDAASYSVEPFWSNTLNMIIDKDLRETKENNREYIEGGYTKKQLRLDTIKAELSATTGTEISEVDICTMTEALRYINLAVGVNRDSSIFKKCIPADFYEKKVVKYSQKYYTAYSLLDGWKKAAEHAKRVNELRVTEVQQQRAAKIARLQKLEEERAQRKLEREARLKANLRNYKCLNPIFNDSYKKNRVELRNFSRKFSNKFEGNLVRQMREISPRYETDIYGCDYNSAGEFMKNVHQEVYNRARLNAVKYFSDYYGKKINPSDVMIFDKITKREKIGARLLNHILKNVPSYRAKNLIFIYSKSVEEYLKNRPALFFKTAKQGLSAIIGRKIAANDVWVSAAATKYFNIHVTRLNRAIILYKCGFFGCRQGENRRAIRVLYFSLSELQKHITLTPREEAKDEN